MALVAALGAAVLYALASVLQHRAAAAQPPERALRVGLLVGLLARRMWLAGIGADIAAYALQFVALSGGSLVLVQPLLVSGLLFAVPLSVALHRCRPTAIDWGGSALVVGGLATFLVVAQPGRGEAAMSGGAWAVLLVATLLPALALALGGRFTGGAVSSGL
ncbi:MAG TPA: DMT family transporter, partial [Acidimicrobiales bacterium]|nr:DMT family transporter [Acidimicrobiales bacterium]